MNRLSLPQCHDALTTTQGAGSARARQPGEGCGGLGALVSRHYCLRPDGGCMAGVLQPLSWEPDSGNRRVVIALLRKGEAAGEQGT